MYTIRTMKYTYTGNGINSLDICERCEDAYKQIDSVFLNTPQFASEAFSPRIAGRVTLKIETINPIGSFKGRGTYYLFCKKSQELNKGVVAASAGNFGQGLAYAARVHKTSCTVFAPLNANPLKIEKMKSFGAEVVLTGKDFDEAKSEAKEWSQKKGIYFVEDGREQEIAIGASTIAFELLKTKESYNVIIVPLGNGSLINGIAKLTKATSPGTQVIGVCAAGAPAMAESYKSRSFVECSSVSTIADGIAVRTPVKEVLPDLYEFVDDVVLVSDEQLREAMRDVYRSHRLTIEPAGVAGLAAVLCDKERFYGKSVAVPLCGSNLTDEQIKSWLI